jgi:hypothetical protein
VLELAEKSYSFPGLPELPIPPVDFLVFLADCRLDISGLSVASELAMMPVPSSTTEMMARLTTLSMAS